MPIFPKTLRRAIGKTASRARTFVASRKNTRKSRLARVKCNFVAETRGPARGSCYEKTDLEIIRDAYNKTRPAHPIRATESDQMLAALERNLASECPREDCWLGQIRNREHRETLLSYAFMPSLNARRNARGEVQEIPNKSIEEVIYRYIHGWGMSFCVIDDPNITYADTENNEIHNEYGEIHKIPRFRDPSDSIKYCVEHMDGIDGIGLVVFLLHGSKGAGRAALVLDDSSHILSYFDPRRDPTNAYIESVAASIIAQCAALTPPVHITFETNCPRGAGEDARIGQLDALVKIKPSGARPNREGVCGLYLLLFIITMITFEDERKLEKSKKDWIEFFRNDDISNARLEKLHDYFFNPEIAHPRSRRSGGGRRSSRFWIHRR
jgi:predicted RNA-binding protein YlxR (DUF448 family)